MAIIFFLLAFEENVIGTDVARGCVFNNSTIILFDFVVGWSIHVVVDRPEWA